MFDLVCETVRWSDEGSPSLLQFHENFKNITHAIFENCRKGAFNRQLGLGVVSVTS